MKKLSFFALAAAGLFLGACSSDDSVVAVDKNAATQYADAFIGISVQLPNAATPTRANDDLNNGLADEFEVKDASLLLFKGSTAESATYIGNWSLTDPFDKDTQEAGDGTPTAQDGVTWDYSDPDGTGVTSTSIAVAQINDLSLLPSEDLYAYVIVNRNGVTLPANGDTFESWMETEFAAAKIGSEYDATNKTDKPIADNGLMMTNAPISMTPGGVEASTGDIIAAVKLDKTKIASTRDAALDAPAGCIYVERSAAKVTAHVSTTATTELLNPAKETMAFELDAFQIINTEPTYYNVRHADVADWLGYATNFAITNSNAKYRFVSLPKFSPTLPDPTGHLNEDKAYRTYFGQDPQYDAPATLQNTVATAEGNWIAPTGRAFVVENTFDVANQTRTNTTQATLRMKLNGGVSFYSITNEATLYAAADIEDAIAAHVETLYGISTFMENAKNYVLQQLDLADTEDEHAYSAEVTIAAELVNAEADAEAGNQAYTLSYTITAKEDGANITAPALSAELTAAWDAAVSGAQADYKVTLYKGGMTYYNVRIQHFGEAETPWDNQTDEGVIKVQPGETVAQIYGYTGEPAAQALANNRFLGRYGVVRDNWYDLSVESIKKLGTATPTPVNGDNTPDDTIEEQFYISCHVHIVPWVLRTQSVKF